MKGDLDWIALKALEKDRTRRYDGPLSLADDVQRFLNDEVINARPPSISYVCSKFLRKNKKYVMFSVAVFGLALISASTISILWHQLSAARHSILAETTRAESESRIANESRKANDELNKQLLEFSERMNIDAIPQNAFREYITKGKANESVLRLQIEDESKIGSQRLDAMQAGAIQIPTRLDSPGVYSVEIMPPGSKPKFYFRSSDHKNAAIARMNARLLELRLLQDRIPGMNNTEQLFELLWLHGPSLDIRNNQSVGFVEKGRVIELLDKHNVLVLLANDIPCVLRVDSVSGLLIGEEKHVGLVYLNGLKMIDLMGVEKNVISLRAISKEQLWDAFTELEPVLSNTNSQDHFRTWKSSSGGFTAEAVLVSSDNTEVTLRLRNGKKARVAIAELCDEDKHFLSKVRTGIQ